MLRTIMSMVVLVVLAGCMSLDPNVIGGSGIPAPQDLDAAMNSRFDGRSFNEVLLRYGQPSGHVPYGTDITVYQFQTIETPCDSGTCHHNTVGEWVPPIQTWLSERTERMAG